MEEQNCSCGKNGKLVPKEGNMSQEWKLPCYEKKAQTAVTLRLSRGPLDERTIEEQMS